MSGDERPLSFGALRNFRRHPDKEEWWVFKERWFLGRVWEIPGNADMSGARQYFVSAVQTLDTRPVWLAVGVVGHLFVLWARRRWLDFHGRRVPRSIWRRARPVPWVRTG